MYYDIVFKLYKNACIRIQWRSMVVFQRRNGGAHPIRAGLVLMKLSRVSREDPRRRPSFICLSLIIPSNPSRLVACQTRLFNSCQSDSGTPRFFMGFECWSCRDGNLSYINVANETSLT